MATCKSCGDEVAKLVSTKVGGRAQKMCEECADRAREEAEIGAAGEAVMQGMMGYKGRR